MNAVIVTGATGFLGNAIVPELLKGGHRVICLTREPDEPKRFPWSDHVEWMTWDLFSSSVPKVPPGSGLIHLAWPGLPKFGESFHVERNYPSSLQFVRSLVEAGVSKVLVAGTCLEYGMRNGALTVDTPTDPTISYAIAKDALRQDLEALAQDMPFTLQWARLFYLFGPGQSPHALLPQLDRAIEAGDASFPMSGGEQVRDFIEVAEAAVQIMRLYASEQSGIFNICSGKPISVRLFVEAYVRERKARIRLDLGHFPYPDYEPMSFWGVPWLPPE